MIKTLRHVFTPHHSNNHRPQILHPEGLFILSLVLVGVLVCTRLYGATSLPTILGFASSITASQVLDQTNQARASAGQPPLTMNAQLNQAAVSKGNHMCGEQYWAHIAPDGTTPWVFIKNAGYHYSVAGENLARDFADTPSMISAWLASPTHKANIMNDRYQEIGVAVIDCKLLGSDTALVVQMFGTQALGTPTTTSTAAKTAVPANNKTTTTSRRQEVAGEASVPRLLANANPSLRLETPPPQANTNTIRVFSPLQVTKAVVVSILTILLFVLILDLWIEHKRQTLRLVGKNLAHIIFLGSIFLAVLIIKVGRIN